MVSFFRRKNRRITPKPASKATRAKRAKERAGASKPAKKPAASGSRSKNAKAAKSRAPKSRTPKTQRSPRAARPPLDWTSLAQGLGLGLVALAALVLLPDPRGLWEPWEAGWAQAAREMHSSGAWFQPTLNGWDFNLRSPLAYWPLIFSYELFGPSEFSARLAGAMWGALLVVVIHSLASGIKGRWAGAGAALVTLCCLSFWAAARICLLDMGLVCGLALSLDGLWTAFKRESGPCWRFWLGMLLCFALGGLGALLPPMAAAALLALLTRRIVWLRAVLAWPGLAAFGLGGIGLLLLVCLNNDNCWAYFMSLPLQGEEKYYLAPAWLLAGAFPYLCLLPYAVLHWCGDEDAKPGSLLLLMVWPGLLWAAAPIMKLGSLALALAMWTPLTICLGPALSGLLLQGRKSESPASLTWALVLLACLLLILALAYPLLPGLLPGLDYGMFGLSLLAIPCAAAGMALLVQLYKRRAMSGLAAPLAVTVVLGLGLLLAMPSLDRERSLRRLMEVMQGELTSRDSLVSYGQYWPGFAFYGGRPVSLARPGEFTLRPHLAVPPQSERIIPSDVQLIRLMQRRDTRLLVVAKQSDFIKLREKTTNVPGLLLFEWARRGDWILFSNRPL